MFDLISVGDVALDHFCKISDAEVRDEKVDKLCLEFGEKLPIEQYQQTVGGNNGNNAVGSSRLGLRVAAYLNIGDDTSGKNILECLKREKVDTRYIVINEGIGSNSSILISFKGERTILTYHQTWKYNLPGFDKTKWVYLSSLAKSYEDSFLFKELVMYLERTGAKLAFNPGETELSIKLKKVGSLLPFVSLLIVNKNEAELILEKEEGTGKIKELLDGLAGLGPKMVVITDGKNGSYGYDGETMYFLEAFPAKLLDMTGAGDAYSTGTIAGLIYGNDLKEAMRWGAVNGASVVEQIGAQAGLLTYDKLQERLKENPKIIAKVI